jgi:C4-dicarboxylate-specific signal transduction histidine kinase
MPEAALDIAILIVDDNPAKLKALAQTLANLNLTIVRADSGKEALRQLLQRDFAAVLLDINMPIMDGFTTAALIRQRPSSEHLPIIFITSERMADEERMAGYQLGAVDYIISPILPEIIRTKVSVFADLYRLRALSAQNASEIQCKNEVIAGQNRQLAESNQQLQQLNRTLEQRISDEVNRSREKDHLLIHQSRLAVMGEMIGNIAHQWRQPLNALALALGNIKDADAYQQLTPAYLAQKIAESQSLIDKMSATISDFRNFFRPDKIIQPFRLLTAVTAAVSMIEASFKAHNIEVALATDEDVWTSGVANEYSQVMLNLLSNAKEAILARTPASGRIAVQLGRAGNLARLTITDNGSGINEEARSHLFEPYFSTKEGGAGIGLYMSKMIIENSMGGEILARNLEAGAEFTLLTPFINKKQA